MALAVTVVDRQDIGDAERIIADITFDSSYPWNGESITAADFGFRVGGKLFSVAPSTKGKFRLESISDPALSSRVSRDDRRNLIIREAEPNRQDFFLGTPLLAIGTSSAAEIKRTNPIRSIAGATAIVGLELAAGEDAFTATTHDIAADADTPQERWYLLSSIDGAAVVVTPGTIADEGVAVPPAIPSDAAPIGLVKIVVAAGATPFNATTDLLSASHLTVTFEDLDQQVYQADDLSALTMRVVAEGR
ncbi:hypothetical protein LCGC14_0979430 [marine sediment metagenome]|uniref:Uncharacterized protein n=1 Tax=marine sediment metagenome TaxID=412755 RepID=A0A0F9RFR0_9ZZZZ